jgi:hypothetical protein
MLPTHTHMQTRHTHSYIHTYIHTCVCVCVCVLCVCVCMCRWWANMKAGERLEHWSFVGGGPGTPPPADQGQGGISTQVTGRFVQHVLNRPSLLAVLSFQVYTYKRTPFIFIREHLLCLALRAACHEQPVPVSCALGPGLYLQENAFYVYKRTPSVS